ncbi:MAG: MazG-like family protein [archaeon]
MNDSMEKLAKFNIERGWDKDKNSKLIKDFLLNMTEEVGEAWNIIKWVDGETQSKLIEEHKAEFIDFVGDQLFLILKIAWMLDIDPQQAFDATMREYEGRFPVDKMKKVKHGNPLAGGIDNKQNKH